MSGASHNLEQLPTAILHRILRIVFCSGGPDGVRHVVRVGTASKRLRAACLDDDLWSALYRSSFLVDLPLAPNLVPAWRQFSAAQNSGFGTVATKTQVSGTMRVLILGIEQAGKTQILYTLKLNEFITTIPTIGFNVETMYTVGGEVVLWDVGGQPLIRQLWKHYYSGTNGLIWVIDASDRTRLQDSILELKEVLRDMDLEAAASKTAPVPVLILANKQDMDNCVKTWTIIQFIRQSHIQLDARKWYIQPCSCLQNSGTEAGIIWLVSSIASNCTGSVPVTDLDSEFIVRARPIITEATPVAEPPLEPEPPGPYPPRCEAIPNPQEVADKVLTWLDSIPEIDDKIKELYNMGFPPRTIVPALLRSEGDIGGAVGWIISKNLS
ncbi:ADP ribosylation factor 6 [Pelomyxa schiedti]|nr:ADP ribosylation factor 6 [Pelomyxa schiedti]